MAYPHAWHLIIATSDFDQLGDPKIEDLWDPSGRHQNITRLQVMVNNGMLVGEVGCLTDLGKESQSREHVQVSAITVFADALALDVVHHKVCPTLFSHSCGKQRGDVGMVA